MRRTDIEPVTGYMCLHCSHQSQDGTLRCCEAPMPTRVGFLRPTQPYPPRAPRETTP